MVESSYGRISYNGKAGTEAHLSVWKSILASERIFSCSGKIVSKKRTLLKPDRVNMLVFSQELLGNRHASLY